MRTVVLLSGGLDSAVLLADRVRAAQPVHALSVHYGQRHARELESAALLASHYGVEHEVVDLSELRHVLRGSSQTDPTVEVPEGHYAAESMKATVVPNRNMILLSVAVGYAISVGADRVGYAAHAGDHPIYPDCRPEFMRAFAGAVALCDERPPILWAPFRYETKASIVRKGAALSVPFGVTWSCYKGGTVHCGRCGTCVERREAFQLAGVVDPTEYEK